MIANRNKTIKEIKEKRRRKLRASNINVVALRYKDWTYSFGILPPKKRRFLQWLKKKQNNERN
jgi:hypothetical protein